MRRLKLFCLNCLYISVTGAMLGSFLWAALGAGVSHLTH
jgi:hypothetical protein